MNNNHLPNECSLCNILILNMESHLKRFHDREKEDMIKIVEKKEEDTSEKYDLIFDLETIGLPKQLGWNNYYDPHKIKHYENSRVIELGYMVCSKDGDIIREVSYLVQYDEDVEITNSHIHGITEDMVKRDGENITYVLDLLLKDLETVDNIIAHNIGFYYNILLSECYRLKYTKLIDCLKSKNQECTMKIGSIYMKSRKSVKLIELFQNLFDVEIKQKHRALEDVDLSAKCYYKLKQKMV